MFLDAVVILHRRARTPLNGSAAMNNETLIRLSRSPGKTAWLLTIASCALVVGSSVTGHPLLLTMLAVCVPLALAAAIQVTAVAPLASELLRLREEFSKPRA